MNKQRLAILVLTVFGGLATFMPWVKAPVVGSVSGTVGDGWITLGLFSIGLVFCLLGGTSKSLQGGAFYGAIFPPLFASLIGIWKIVDFNSKMAKLRGNPFAKAFEASVSIEYGLYILVVAGLLVPIVAFALKDKESQATN